MARITSYPKHIPVQPNDTWIGTRASNLMTRNFTAKAVGEYINISGLISISACMLYKFEITNAGPGDITGVPDLTPFANITSLNINAIDISGQNTVGFLEYIVGTEILISEQNEISTFGHYNIDSYTQIGTTSFYTLNLTFIGGSGSIEEKKQYDTCSFVLSSTDNNTTYDLDSIQNGANSDIRLVGSDLTTDIVKLEAGTNVTLTDTGSNILIDVTAVGTVTSIDASIDGDSLSIAGVPITSAGTIAFNWEGTNLQYVDGEGNLQTFPTLPTGTVTSVGQTHAGNAFSVTGSPITTAGVLAIGLNGNATQYIDGAGDLQTFPAIPVVPSNIVETLDTTDGTYIDLTPNAPTTGDVVVTADLSAIDGNAAAGERYLTKTNLWAEISTIPGTYEWEIQGDTGGPTVVNSTNIVTFVGGTNVSTALVGTTLTIDATDTNTTYDLTVPVATTNITLLGSDASSDSVTLTGGTNITVTRVSATELSIDGTDLNTTYNLEGVGSVNGTAGVRLAGSDASNDDVLIIGAGTTTVTRSLNTLTVTSNDQFDGTVTSVSASTTGDALDVAVTNPTTTPDLDFTWAGTASQYVDGQGDLQTFPAIPVVPSNIVETFSNNNTGTYVAYGNINSSATGDVNIGEVDLTAIDGTAIAGERYLTKSNAWATVASIPGTYEWSIAADSGGETILSGDTVNFIGGTNVTTSYDSGLNELTINSTDQFQGTVTSVATTHAGNAFTANIGNVATINPSVDITMNGSSADYIDGAGNLQTFPTIPQGDITDVEGGTYITTVNSTGPVVTVNHDSTLRTDTASATTPSAGDTITAVDSVTTNTTGHVEAINLKSVTLPTGSLTSEVVDIQVKNISSANGGINLVKGDPVYIYGSVGASARLYVDLADADSTATNNLGDNKMPVVGLLDQDLSPNGEGTATVVGKLRNLITSPIDSATPNENDTIYVKSGGGLTLTKPTGSTNLIQNVGQVGRVSTSSDGNIVVAALLRSNDVPNLPTGRIWVGDGNTIVSDTVYVDEPNNRVGIGTTTPSTDLEVSSTGVNGVDISQSASNASQSGRLFFTTNTASEGFALFNSNGTFQVNSGGIPNNTSGTNRISIIGSSGNVGIGTTSPGSKLTVNGSTRLGGDVEVSELLSGDKVLTLTANTGSFNIGDIDGLGDRAFISGDSSSIEISINQSTSLYCDSNNRVGIGTTSPTQKLHVDGNARLTGLFYDGTNSGGTNGQILSSDGGQTEWIDGSAIPGVPAGSGTVNYLARWTPNNDTLGIGVTYDNGTNVGIGTTSPSELLHISSLGPARLLIEADRDNVTETDNAQIILKQDGGAVVGNLGFKTNTNGLEITNQYTGADGILTFGTNGTERMRVKYTGEVGIGTTNPTQKLAVSVTDTTQGFSIGAFRFDAISNYGSSKNILFHRQDANQIVVNEDGADLDFRAEGSSDTNLFKVDAGLNNVGIGTASPDAKLEVSSSSGGVLRLTSSDTSVATGESIGRVEFKSNDASTGGNNIMGFVDCLATNAGSTYALTFGTGNAAAATEKMRIEPSGNVGMGTTSPYSKLQVASAAGSDVPTAGTATGGLFVSNSNKTYGINMGVSGSGWGFIQSQRADGLTNLYGLNLQPLGGNVGIGTTNPQAKLHVANGTLRTWTPTSGTSAIFESTVSNRNFVTLTAANEAELWFGNAATQAKGRVRYEMANNNMEFWTNATQKMVINGSGNVGIGTTSLTSISSTSRTLSLGSTSTTTSGGIAFQANSVVKAYNYVTNNYLINQTVPGIGQIFYGAGSERMRIHNTTGNVGIGTTSPNEKLEVAGSTRITGNGLDVGYANNGTNFIQIGNGRTTNGFAYIDLVGDSTYSDYGLRIIRNSLGANTSSELIHRGTGIFNFNASQAASITFRTSNVERLRVNSSGNVGIGTTSPNSKLHVAGTVSLATPLANFDGSVGSGVYGAVSVRVDNINYGTAMKFYRSLSADNNAIGFQNGASTVGSISIGTSSTAYNTTSDYRLKENLTAITDGIDRLKQLKPRRFNFIGSADVVDGFIAHEAKEVIPESVTGEKDEVLPNGDPVYQGIDQAKIVPLLTAALQEAVTRIEQLETRIQKLENK